FRREGRGVPPPRSPLCVNLRGFGYSGVACEGRARRGLCAEGVRSARGGAFRLSLGRIFLQGQFGMEQLRCRGQLLGDTPQGNGSSRRGAARVRYGSPKALGPRTPLASRS